MGEPAINVNDAVNQGPNPGDGNGELPNNPAVPQLAENRQNVDAALRLQQRRIDAAIRSIPELSFPVSLWSKKIRILLEIRGGLDLANADLVEEILPSILTKLPVGLVSMVPRGSVEQALNFLDLYDKAPLTIEGTFLQERSADIKPSIHFVQLKQQYRETLRTEDDLILNRMAWETLKRSLPPQVKTMSSIIVHEPGNADQMQQLDRVWSEMVASKDDIQHFNNVNTSRIPIAMSSSSENKTPSVFDLLLTKLDKMGSSLETFVNHVQQTNQKSVQFRNPRQNAQFSPKTDRQSRFNSSKTVNHQLPQSRHNPDSTQRSKSADQNLRPYKYPHRLDFCYYHQRFGADALNCRLPCAFVVSNNRLGSNSNGSNGNNFNRSKN